MSSEADSERKTAACRGQRGIPYPVDSMNPHSTDPSRLSHSEPLCLAGPAPSETAP